MVRKNNNKGYVLTEVLVVTVVVMAAFLAIYVNYYPMLGEYERRVAYTNLEPKYSLFYMKKLYLTSYVNNEKILSEFRSNNNLKYLNLLKTEGNKLVCKDNYVDDLVSCNSLIEYHGIKQLIVSEYNVDDLKSVSIGKNLDKYIDYLPSYKYVNDKKLFRLTIETDAGYATTEFDLLRTRKSLYAVLEDAAYDGTYAKKYTGSHQDSMDASLSRKDIYYWYGSNAANGTAILDKNNVIFANHCWQMIRTTDTGGVRMIYNGEVVDGKCLNTRGTHVGYGGSRSSQSLNGTYWYGTDYTYDSSTNKFSISGTKTSTQVTTSNGSTVIPTLVGKYTCKSTSESGTCSTLYLIESYNSSYNAYAISLNSSSHYSQFGKSQYSLYNDSPAYVGYMYNTIYTYTTKRDSYSIAENGKYSIPTSGYYSDTVNYDSATNTYALTNPIAVSTLTDYSELVGKYFANYSTNRSNIVYIVAIVDTNYYYGKILKDGDLNKSIMMGDSYIDNGNGTYTINNATSLSYIDWYNSTSTTRATYKGKYVCVGTSSTCNNLRRINSVYSTYFYAYSTSNNYKYSSSVNYNNGTYTLNDNIEEIWDIYDNSELSKLSTRHYTCLSLDSNCTTLYYVYSLYGGQIYYLSLTGVSNIESALVNMLSADNVNTKNSVMKTGVDAWYKKYLLPYDSYIDDTIYCNNRSISALGSFNPNGGGVTSDLAFSAYSTSKDLNCTNITDKFSVSNSRAQLTYKVGLISAPEKNLLNYPIILATGESYWTSTPTVSGWIGGLVYGAEISSSGGWGSTSYYGVRGVRPVISLIPGMRYSSGDGSMANPYVVIADEPSG